MSLFPDRFFRALACFLALFSVLLVCSLLLLSAWRADAVKELCLRHDEAVASSLLAQGVSKDVVAAALTSTDVSPGGEALSAALRRMEQLIQSLLKITRLDSGAIEFAKTPCPLSELVSLSLRDLSTRAECEEKRLITEGDAALTLLCDPDWTSEAIANIVKNALDHTAPGAAVRISWARAPGMIRICVSDDGPGIAPEDIHHIFKRFYRSRRSLDTQGVGLGLPLAKAIVEGQGGVISVRSAPGEGTVFTLSFLAEL